MKKLNITKEQFEKSRYFKNKYGTLEYVSESGKLFNDTPIYGIDSGYVKETGWRARIYKDNGMYEYTIEQWDDRRKEWMKTSFGTPSRSIEQMLEDLATETDGTDIPICCELPLARKVASVMKNFQLNESRKLFKTSKGKVLMFREGAESSPRFRCMEDAGVTTSTGGHYATFLTDMVAGFLEKQRGIDNVEHGDDGILVTFSDGGQVVVSFETVQH